MAQQPKAFETSNSGPEAIEHRTLQQLSLLKGSMNIHLFGVVFLYMFLFSREVIR